MPRPPTLPVQGRGRGRGRAGWCVPSTQWGQGQRTGGWPVPHEGLLSVSSSSSSSSSLSGAGAGGGILRQAAPGGGVWQQMVAVTAPGPAPAPSSPSRPPSIYSAQQLKEWVECGPVPVLGGGEHVDTEAGAEAIAVQGKENERPPLLLLLLLLLLLPPFLGKAQAQAQGLLAVLPFYWNIYSQTSQRSPPPPHLSARGGILADDMGLGKTVMATSLIAADYIVEQEQEQGQEPEAAGGGSSSSSGIGKGAAKGKGKGKGKDRNGKVKGEENGCGEEWEGGGKRQDATADGRG